MEIEKSLKFLNPTLLASLQDGACALLLDDRGFWMKFLRNRCDCGFWMIVVASHSGVVLAERTVFLVERIWMVERACNPPKKSKRVGGG